jgi:type III secretion protein V
LGIRVPPIGLRPHAGQEWQLLASGVPLGEGKVPAQDPPGTIAGAVLQALRRNTERYFSASDAIELRSAASREIPEVVDQLRQSAHLYTEVLQALVKEGVSVRNRREVFEAMLCAAWRGIKDARGQIEFVRGELKHQISHQAAPDGRLRAVTLSPELEALLTEAATVHNGVHGLRLAMHQTVQLTQALAACVRQAGTVAVVVQARHIRHHVRDLLAHDCFDTPVLSTAELLGNVQIEVVATVNLSSSAAEPA